MRSVFVPVVVVLVAVPAALSVAPRTASAQAAKPSAVQGATAPRSTAPRTSSQTPRPASQTPARPAAQTPAPMPAPVLPPSPLATCTLLSAADAQSILGPDASPSSAPSKSLFISCGYTSQSGNALTVSSADYGAASVALEFFKKTSELLKTTRPESDLGEAAFSNLTAQPVPTLVLTAVQASKIFSLELTGPLAARPETLAKLRPALLNVLKAAGTSTP